MPKVTFLTATSAPLTADVRSGLSLMEAAIQLGVEGIEAECGGACSCATCHVYIDSEWMVQAGLPQTMESEMLDFAWQQRENSRLSCQIRLTPKLDGLRVTVPERQGQADDQVE
jgi:ferredoxin, 2Fe-2S